LGEKVVNVPANGIIQIKVVSFEKTELSKDSVVISALLLSEDKKQIVADLLEGGGWCSTGYSPGVRYLSKGM